jgi:hypothetical protein
MTTQTKKPLKRTAKAIQCINTGKRFQIRTRKWTDPISRNRRGFLRIDRQATTLRGCQELERHAFRSTSDNTKLVVAVLRDQRKCGQFWIWIWDSDSGVHIVEPAGTDVEALNKDLAERFPNA